MTKAYKLIIAIEIKLEWGKVHLLFKDKRIVVPQEWRVSNK